MSTPCRSRRLFLTGRLDTPRNQPVRPPRTDEASIVSSCTSCGACLDGCPEGIIDWDPERRPVVNLRRGECTFCGKCADACTAPVFIRGGQTAFRHIAGIGTACLTARGVVCGSCGDVCMQGAITFRPRIGAPPLPVIVAERCNGCGACIAICPAGAIAPSWPEAEAPHA